MENIITLKLDKWGEPEWNAEWIAGNDLYDLEKFEKISDEDGYIVNIPLSDEQAKIISERIKNFFKVKTFMESMSGIHGSIDVDFNFPEILDIISNMPKIDIKILPLNQSAESHSISACIKVVHDEAGLIAEISSELKGAAFENIIENEAGVSEAKENKNVEVYMEHEKSIKSSNTPKLSEVASDVSEALVDIDMNENGKNKTFEA